MTRELYRRDALQVLEKWSEAPERKPLVIRGARQVGKSCLVEMFARRYSRRAILNLERPSHAELFRKKLDLHELLQSILLECSVPPGAEPLLVFIDEIQEVPEAVAMLRFFMEERPDIHVIAAGSLLEIAIERAHISFPVGRVQYLYLRPFTFREFVDAMGIPGLLDALSEVPVPVFAHGKLLELFHMYACVGGMPEAVSTYISSGMDITATNLVYADLFASFHDDIGKYGRNETMKRVLLHVCDHAPFDAGSRIKFNGFGGSNYRSREVGEALRQLEGAMLVELVYPSTAVKEPLEPAKRKSPRLHFLDTGLVSHRAGLQKDLLAPVDLTDRHRGRVIEQIVGQELKALKMREDVKLVFWVREKAQANAEVDCLLRTRNGIVPLEAKAGASGKLRSLHQYMARSKSSLAVRLYAGEYSWHDVSHEGVSYRLINVPYYTIGTIEEHIECAISQ